MNWVDYVVIVILLVNGIGGLSKGLIITVFNLFGFILSLYIAKLYYPVVANFIKNNPNIIGTIKEYVTTRVEIIMNKIGNSGSIGDFFEILKLPSKLGENMINDPNVNSYMNNTMNTASDMISTKLTGLFIDIISIIIVFLAAKFILYIIVSILDNIAHLPVLRQINKLAGLVFGLIKGVFILYILFAIITPVITMFPDGAITKGVYDSTIGYYLYSNNLIIDYLKGYGLFK
ncbi:Colicin V production protein [Caloranaerobacter azorensis DSM 13643]|uniref:Colicin V production protein n=1 Tax=Caloranaerobacter azorensis DSM 13643 TaxID=1121264 RepID=A0A1M5TMD6_9FIRM|nr:CvpA family protein [Caloranaerobacter azorensis]SHH51848.1 Colicin V production protein [Caloranaerobacter azorensis DSM 13643]